MTPDNQAFYHITTADGIHLFQFNVLSPKTIDRYIETITPIYMGASPHDLLRLCLDFAVPELQHITYGFRKMRALLAKRSDNLPYARYALLHDEPSMLAVCNSLLQLTPHAYRTTLRFYHRQTYEIAIAWLLTGD